MIPMANKKLMVLDTHTLRKLLCTLMELHNPQYVICVKHTLGLDYADMELVEEMLDTYLGITPSMEWYLEDHVIEQLCRVLLKEHDITIQEMYCHSSYNPDTSETYYTCYLQLSKENIKRFNTLVMQLNTIISLKNSYSYPLKECTFEDFSVLTYNDLLEIFKGKINSIANSKDLEVGICNWSEYNMYAGQLDITFKNQTELGDIINIVSSLVGTNLKLQDIDFNDVYPRVLVPLTYFEPLVRSLMGIPNETNLICCNHGFMSCLSDETNAIELLGTNGMTITCMKVLDVMPYDTCESMDYILIPVSA